MTRHSPAPAPMPASATGATGNDHDSRQHADIHRRFGRYLLPAGSLLIILGFFSPWYDLSTSFSGYPRHQHMAPWNLVQQSSGNERDLFVMGLVLPCVALIGCSLGLVVARHARLHRVLFLASLILCACFIAVTLLVTQLLPTGLSLSYPYYDVTSYSAMWVELGGLVVLLAGILSQHAPSTRSWRFE